MTIFLLLIHDPQYLLHHRIFRSFAFYCYPMMALLLFCGFYIVKKIACMMFTLHVNDISLLLKELYFYQIPYLGWYFAFQLSLDFLDVNIWIVYLLYCDINSTNSQGAFFYFYTHHYSLTHSALKPVGTMTGCHLIECDHAVVTWGAVCLNPPITMWSEIS